jgi:dTDP-4-dehydrorhamnose reductase
VKVLITGAGGQLGRELMGVFSPFSSDDVIAPNRGQCDVRDRDAVVGLLTSLRPDAVVHAAAWTAVDACEADAERAWVTNAMGTRHIAEGARLAGAHLCVISTDYVFDGTSDRPYVEWDPTGPINVYGASKLAAEREATAVPGVCIVRTSWLCGAGGPNFVATMLGLAARGDRRGEVPVVADQYGCPTFASDLAPAIRQLVAARLPGVFHVTNEGPTTWYEFARATFAAAGQDPSRVLPIATADLDPPRAARRPMFSVLDNAAMRFSGLPLLGDHHDSLERLVKELSA